MKWLPNRTLCVNRLEAFVFKSESRIECCLFIELKRKESMLKFLLLITGWLCAMSAFAQQKPFLQEEFNNNTYKWTERDDATGQAKVANGHYHLAHLRSGSFLQFTKEIYINPENNFSIEATFKQTEGSVCAMVWGTKDYDNNFKFAIDQMSGRFAIFGYIKKEPQIYKNWEASTSVKRNGVYNKVNIVKRDGKLEFYLNDTKVHSMYFQPFVGLGVGFELVKRSVVEVDQFIVRQPPVKINLLSGAEKTGSKQNLGRNVNSEHTELSPIISPDGNTLYICRFHPDNLFGEQTSEIWYANKLKDGTWGKAKNIGKPLNNKASNWVISVTPDGNSLLLSGTYGSAGQASGEGMSIAHRTASGWGVPQYLNIDNYYNTNRFSSASLSADRKILLLSLERKDSKGDLDLYVCFSKGENHFSEPKNLGTMLNTFAGDFTPFLAADNTTLYFASKGRPGYGDADVFVTKRLDNTWTNWSEPQNLGSKVNTDDFDSYFSVSAMGKYAYLISYENTLGKGDVFKIKLPQSALPEPIVFVTGKVINDKDESPLEATITYYNLKTGKEVGVARSNPKDGSYAIALPYGEHYGFHAEKKNYYALSQNVDVTTANASGRVLQDLRLYTIDVGQTVRLNNIYFETAKSTLQKVSNYELDRLIKFLKKNSTIKLEIAGHTDNVGSNETNLKLSNDRANAVRNYLLSGGIPANRLTAKGYGESNPISHHPEGRSKNRRVEFKITSK
jgi:outer membrane protein OmpA-like peptidoglycan-associated protein